VIAIGSMARVSPIRDGADHSSQGRLTLLSESLNFIFSIC
jgi:hypothetical protein